MKPILHCLLGLALLAPGTALAQNIVPPPSKAAIQEPPLTKFDLDFPGGTPRQLVDAIQAASGKPLNAVIPSDAANYQLPPLKMKGVDVAHLFDALTSTGRINRQVVNPAGGYWAINAQWQFQTDDRTPTDASIWYFNVHGNDQPPQPYRVCRFYLLTPYLERGLTVDDITTAVETGWKMLGEPGGPALSFHKETNLLIAVGTQRQLDVVESTLRALDTSKSRAAANTTPVANKAP